MNPAIRNHTFLTVKFGGSTRYSATMQTILTIQHSVRQCGNWKQCNYVGAEKPHFGINQSNSVDEQLNLDTFLIICKYHTVFATIKNNLGGVHTSYLFWVNLEDIAEFSATAANFSITAQHMVIWKQCKHLGRGNPSSSKCTPSRRKCTRISSYEKGISSQ